MKSSGREISSSVKNSLEVDSDAMIMLLVEERVRHAREILKTDYPEIWERIKKIRREGEDKDNLRDKVRDKIHAIRFVSRGLMRLNI